MFLEDPQCPERVRIEVSGNQEKEHDAPTSNKMTGPQLLKERTDVEVEVERKEEVESARVEERKDNQPTDGRQSQRLRRAPARDDDKRFLKTSYVQQKGPGGLERVNKAIEILKDPTTYEEAMSRGNARHWKRACAEELNEFVRQNLFSTVPRPIGRKVIGCKWVFKTKLDTEGQIEHYKAGIDFDEMFAPIMQLKEVSTGHQGHRLLRGIESYIKGVDEGRTACLPHG